MTTETITTGRRPDRVGRAPRRMPAGRVCAHPDCDTRLTTYNRNDTCYRHSPIRYPRNRGRIGSR